MRGGARARHEQRHVAACPRRPRRLPGGLRPRALPPHHPRRRRPGRGDVRAEEEELRPRRGARGGRAGAAGGGRGRPGGAGLGGVAAPPPPPRRLEGLTEPPAEGGDGARAAFGSVPRMRPMPERCRGDARGGGKHRRAPAREDSWQRGCPGTAERHGPASPPRHLAISPAARAFFRNKTAPGTGAAAAGPDEPNPDAGRGGEAPTSIKRFIQVTASRKPKGR